MQARIRLLELSLLEPSLRLKELLRQGKLRPSAQRALQLAASCGNERALELFDLPQPDWCELERLPFHEQCFWVADCLAAVAQALSVLPGKQHLNANLPNCEARLSEVLSLLREDLRDVRPLLRERAAELEGACWHVEEWAVRIRGGLHPEVDGKCGEMRRRAVVTGFLRALASVAAMDPRRLKADMAQLFAATASLSQVLYLAEHFLPKRSASRRARPQRPPRGWQSALESGRAAGDHLHRQLSLHAINSLAHWSWAAAKRLVA